MLFDGEKMKPSALKATPEVADFRSVSKQSALVKMEGFCDGSCGYTEARDFGLARMIRDGNLTEVMFCLFHMITRHDNGRCITRTRLIGYVGRAMAKSCNQTEEHRENFRIYQSLFQNLHERHKPQTPDEYNFSPFAIYARLGLRDRVIQMMNDDRGICEEEKAAACEFLQVVAFDSQLTRNVWHQPNNELEFFRMAQRIRDEAGIVRPPTPGKCFNNLDDIVEIERQNAEGNVVEYLVQCCVLGVVDSRHLYSMFHLLHTYSHLTEFYTKVYQVRQALGETFPYIDFWFCRRFQLLRSAPLMWHQIVGYLKVSTEFSSIWFVQRERPRFEIIPEEARDSYLSYCLEYVFRCISEILEFDVESPGLVSRRPGISIQEMQALTVNLELLLEGGASLHFTIEERARASLEYARAYPNFLPDEEFPSKGDPGFTSSAAFLLEIAKVLPAFFISKLQRYLCCPIDSQNITFDRKRPARLTCLAARACRPTETCSRVPEPVILWIKIHRELMEVLRA